MSINGIESISVKATRNEYNRFNDNRVDFKLQTLYINNTNEDFFITQRNNLVVKIEPYLTNACENTGSFIVRKIYSFVSEELVISTITNITEFQQRYGTRDNDLTLIKEGLKQALAEKDKNLCDVRIVVDRHIDIKSLRKHKHIYLPQDDVLLSNGKEPHRHPHPYSPEGLVQKETVNSTIDNKASGIFIQLVDNENIIDKRFIYLAKNVVEIPAVVDHEKESGVYFTKSEYHPNGDVTIETRFYTHDEAKVSLGLHKTVEEAQTGGDPEMLSKAEVERNKAEAEKLKVELIQTKHNLEMDKASLEKDVLIHKEKLTRVSMDLEEAKLKNDKLKEELELAKLARSDYFDERKTKRSDYYEDRSYHRKESLELWKWIPAAIVAGVGLYQVVKK